MDAGGHRAGRALCCAALAAFGGFALGGCALAAGDRANTGSAASCTAPILTTIPRPPQRAALLRVVPVTPGQKLRLYGYWYMTCDDTNPGPASHPFRQLTILVIQGHARHALATVQASGRDGDFSIVVRLPAGLRRGRAVIRTSLLAEQPVPLRVRR
jgi:hypothetical protein